MWNLLQKASFILRPFKSIPTSLLIIYPNQREKEQMQEKHWIKQGFLYPKLPCLPPGITPRQPRSLQESWNKPCTKAFPQILGCLKTILNGDRWSSGYLWLEQDLLYPSTSCMPPPTHYCPQATWSWKDTLEQSRKLRANAIGCPVSFGNIKARKEMWSMRKSWFGCRTDSYCETQIAVDSLFYYLFVHFLSCFSS